MDARALFSPSFPKGRENIANFPRDDESKIGARRRPRVSVVFRRRYFAETNSRLEQNLDRTARAGDELGRNACFPTSDVFACRKVQCILMRTSVSERINRDRFVGHRGFCYRTLLAILPILHAARLLLRKCRFCKPPRAIRHDLFVIAVNKTHLHRGIS